MIKLDKKPSEEVYEIVLYGTFDPPKFRPIWFAENGLLGQKEALDAEIFNIDEDEANFFTQFITIHVNSQRFKISTTQLLSWNLVEEMSINVAKILKQSLDNACSLNVALHYSFKSDKKLTKVLNKFNRNEIWAGVLKNPQLNKLSISELVKVKHGFSNRTIDLSECDREDMKSTIHLFIYNTFYCKKENKITSYHLDGKQLTLKESIAIANKLVNTYF